MGLCNNCAFSYVERSRSRQSRYSHHHGHGDPAVDVQILLGAADRQRADAVTRHTSAMDSVCTNRHVHHAVRCLVYRFTDKWIYVDVSGVGIVYPQLLCVAAGCCHRRTGSGSAWGSRKRKSSRLHVGEQACGRQCGGRGHGYHYFALWDVCGHPGAGNRYSCRLCAGCCRP